MKINFWSDYACPFCWIGEVRMRRALAELGMLENAVLIPRAFELDPGAPATTALNGLATIARRYNMSSGEVQVMFDQIAEQGKADGLVLNQRDTQHANTFNAHRLMKPGLASNDRTLAENLNEDLFAAFFVDNLNLADKDVLMAVGQKAGLAEAEIKKLLATDEYAIEVRADEDAAARLGIHSVPYFIFENGAAAVGALSVEEFKRILQAPGAAFDKSDQCGPEGCRLD